MLEIEVFHQNEAVSPLYSPYNIEIRNQHPEIGQNHIVSGCIFLPQKAQLQTIKKQNQSNADRIWNTV